MTRLNLVIITFAAVAWSGCTYDDNNMKKAKTCLEIRGELTNMDEIAWSQKCYEHTTINREYGSTTMLKIRNECIEMACISFHGKPTL